MTCDKDKRTNIQAESAKKRRKGMSRTKNKEAKLFKQKRDLCCKVILSQFPDMPEARLMHAIVEQAIKDATAKIAPAKTPGQRSSESTAKYEKAKARNFLNGRIWPAEACGVDSDWVRRTINRYDLGWDANQ